MNKQTRVSPTCAAARPWKIGRNGLNDWEIYSKENGYSVATVHMRQIPLAEELDETYRDNAVLIVRAVNSFDAMREALEAAVARVELANAEGNSIMSAWLPEAKAALALTKDMRQRRTDHETDTYHRHR